MNRNDPCPCGSGKRYKHCHGRVDDVRAMPQHTEAEAALRSGALARAEALYREALGRNPSDIESLHRLGVIEFERMHFDAALRLVCEASDRAGWTDPVIRQNLGLVLAKLLAPRANARQKALVDAYGARKRAQLTAPRCKPPVSVVLAATGQLRQTLRAIDSVASQTYSGIELVVVVDERASGEDLAAIAQHLSALHWPSRIVRGACPTLATAFNAGAAQARGTYLSLLTGCDSYVAARVERMVADIAGDTPLWGYSRIAETMADTVRSDRGQVADSMRTQDAPLTEPASFSLLRRDDLLAAGNLLVERGLFGMLGGYRDDAQNPGWEFARRAALVIEPVVVEERLYVRHEPQARSLSDGESDRGYVDPTVEALVIDALGTTNSPANEFCPQHPANRDLVLRAELRAGRADRLPVDMLRSLAAEWLAQLRSRPRVIPAPPPTSGDCRTALVVLGVYRSGTSAVSRALNLCGAFVTDEVKAPQLGLNPKGFWESEAVNDIDARLLHRLGGNWDRVDFELPHEGPIVDEFITQSRDLLAREYGSRPLILLKDPRICVLAPLWHRALAMSGYLVKYVVTVRNPLEVALSLESQGDLSIPDGLALWYAYMERVERFTGGPGIRAVRVAYADLLDDWRSTVRRIAVALDVPLQIDLHEDEVDHYIETALRKHLANETDLEAHLGGPLGDVIRALYRRDLERSRSIGRPGEQVDSEPAFAADRA